MKAPWRDNAGRFSALKAAVFAGLFLPALWLALRAAMNDLGPRPFDILIHETGQWAVYFLLGSLAITPARRILHWPRLILIRRMTGLAAAAYVVMHVFLYIADESFLIGHVAREIVTRIYLTIGFAALTGLLVLSATSTNAMIRRMGAARWNALHRIVYSIGVLAIVHYLMQSKLDIYSASLTGGLLIWLLAYRAAIAKLGTMNLARLAGLAIVAALATALGEALWFSAMTGISGWRVLAANLDVHVMLRPAWWVLMAGLAATGLSLVGERRRMSGSGTRRFAAA